MNEADDLSTFPCWSIACGPIQLPVSQPSDMLCAGRLARAADGRLGRWLYRQWAGRDLERVMLYACHSIN